MLIGKPGDGLRLVYHARACVGVRFRHRGRDPRTGLDCAGLLIHAIKAIGLQPHDLRTYGREPFKDGLADAVLRNLGEPLPEGEPLLPGDIVLMRFSREPHHLGILGDYVHGGLSLIHAYGGVERVVEHRLDDIWRSRVCSTYRLRVE